MSEIKKLAEVLERPETCDWNEIDESFAETECKNDFYFDHENLEDSCSWAKFCIFCGGKIIPHFYVEEDDDAILEAEGE